jgi:hypothetical protein
MTEPTENQWLELHEAFQEYCAAVPWQWFDDSDIVTVELPVTEEKGYCVVLGSGKMVYGLAVYRGDRGLAGFLATMTGMADPGSLDALNITDAVSAMLADREELEKEDRDIIRNLGLRYRGRGRWPLFRAYEPGYLPWRLNAAEILFLTASLKAMTSLALAAKQGDVTLDDEDDSDLFLTLSLQNGRWHGRWNSLTTPQPPLVAEYPDKGRIEQLSRSELRADSVWELGVYFLPTPLWEKRKQRPHLPLCAILVDSDTGVVATELFMQPGSSDADLQGMLVKILESLPGLPSKIVVNTPRLAMLVAPVTAPLGINLSVDETPTLWDAREQLLQHLEDGPPDSC